MAVASSAQHHKSQRLVPKRWGPNSALAVISDFFMAAVVKGGGTQKEAEAQIRLSHGRALLDSGGFNRKTWAAALGSVGTAYTYLKNTREDRRHKKFHETVGRVVVGKSGTLDELVQLALKAVLADMNPLDVQQMAKLTEEVRNHVLVLANSAPSPQSNNSIEGSDLVHVPITMDYSAFSPTVEKCQTALEVVRVALTKKLDEGDIDALARHRLMAPVAQVAAIKLLIWELIRNVAALIEQGRAEEVTSMVNNLRTMVAAGTVVAPNGEARISVEIVTALASGREEESL